jgi:hypothetical protein
VRMIEFTRIRGVLPVLMLLMGLICCTGQNGRHQAPDILLAEIPQNPSQQAVIQFDTLAHDFGTIIEGEKVVCYFDYRNSGGSALVINSVETSCGCTTPDWNNEPLLPGGNDRLKVIFDATGRSGSQRKVVTVRSNAENSEVRLTLTAQVNEKE